MAIGGGAALVVAIIVTVIVVVVVTKKGSSSTTSSTTNTTNSTDGCDCPFGTAATGDSCKASGDLTCASCRATYKNYKGRCYKVITEESGKDYDFFKMWQPTCSEISGVGAYTLPVALMEAMTMMVDEKKVTDEKKLTLGYARLLHDGCKKERTDYKVSAEFNKLFSLVDPAPEPENWKHTHWKTDCEDLAKYLSWHPATGPSALAIFPEVVKAGKVNIDGKDYTVAQLTDKAKYAKDAQEEGEEKFEKVKPAALNKASMGRARLQ